MSTTLDFGVQSVALLGPGLPDWASARPLLNDPSLWVQKPTVVPAPARLPATERRRAGVVVKVAVEVADAACSAAGRRPEELATVFTSSTGDPANCHAMCEALATADRMISPTRFTNSVHNVAGGYWHIATHSMRASTSLCAFDASFGAGLLEAAAQCVHGQVPVLLVACDVPYPEPLHGVRPVADTLAMALVLVPSLGTSLVPSLGSSLGPSLGPSLARQGGRRLRLSMAGSSAVTACSNAGLEALRLQIPAGRALPLLQALASPAAAVVVVEGLPGLALRVEVDPE